MRAGLRVGWFAVTALVSGVLASALQVERLAGDATAPSLVFDVEIPRDALVDTTAAAIEETWRQRLREHDVQVTPAAPAREGHVGVRVTVVGAYPAKAAIVQSALTSGARLEMAMVRDGDRTMAAWYQAVSSRALPGIPPTVEADPDMWMHEATGSEHYDSYLKSASTDDLDRAVALLVTAHPLPDGHEIRYERVEPQGDVDRTPYYRTYLVAEDRVLWNEHIAGAEVQYDPNTLQPEVLVVLTDDGARRFGDATAAGVGHKLAILLDGAVESAPVIQSPIRGGEVSITMGGSDPEMQLAEASALAGALGSRLSLPPGFEARLVAAHDRDAGLGWLLRLLAAALGGVVAVWLSTLFERRRWFSLAPSVSASPGGRERWDALAIPALVTLLVPVLLWYAGSEILLPAINEVEMRHLVRDPSRAARSLLGIFALGLVPVTTGFVLAELYAILVEALVPARRGRRLGTPADRRRLDLAAWILVGLLTLVQSYFFALYLENLATGGAEVYIGSGNTKWVVVLSLTAGVMVQIAVAEAISRRGLVNGFLALLAAAAAFDLFATLTPELDPRALDPHRPSEALLAAIALVAGAATVASTRVRSGTDGPRLPYTGIVPASLVRGTIAIVAFAGVWSPSLASKLVAAQPWAPLIELASAVPITILILLSVRRAWSTPGVAVTLAYLAVFVLLPFAVSEPYRLGVPVAEGVLLGVVGAELWVGTLARVRLPDAVTVLVVHDVDRADAAADRLAAAENEMAEADRAARASLEALSAAREASARAEERMDGAKRRVEDIAREIHDLLEVEPGDLAGLAEFGPGDALPDVTDAEAELEKLRRDRERLGAVNLRAEEELREVETQHASLTTERDDLVEAIKRLRQGIQSLNREARERLLASFEVVNGHFQRLFTELFGGGVAELKLIESDDPLEAGLEIIARPPGKKPQTLSLLSGGEQALTALALIFAVFLTNPSPICVLDEVDAPLDDHNVERFCDLLDEMTQSTDTRFIIITHNPITMSRMNRLYGVTMAERGVSQLVSVDLEDAVRLREAS